MSENSGRTYRHLPEWWNKSLYDFLADMPEEGWVWEFMRRARLRKLLRGRGVNAMNPEPPRIKGINMHYFKTWADLQALGKRPIRIPPAVRSLAPKPKASELPVRIRLRGRRRDWPTAKVPQRAIFRLDKYRRKDGKMEKDGPERVIVPMELDLGRRNTVIKREFDQMLQELRRKHPEPERVFPKTDTWVANHVLEIWDLKQLGVSWSSIKRLFELENQDMARNYIKTSIRNIDDGGWRKLALYLERD
jgi:hypothetical protein